MSSVYPYSDGWGDYADTFYDGTTANKTFTIASGTDYILPNNIQSGPRTQLPNGDITTLYTPQTLNYDNEASGPFSIGETITGGTSSATGKIIHLVDNGTSGTFYLGEVSGTFQNNEQVTGGTSSATADVDGTIEQGGIEGRDGDSIIYTIDFTATPIGGGAATYVEQWIDIGGAVGELYRHIKTFPKGSGVARPVTFTTFAYTPDTWEANKGLVYVSANGDLEIKDIRILIGITHRARKI